MKHLNEFGKAYERILGISLSDFSALSKIVTIKETRLICSNGMTRKVKPLLIFAFLFITSFSTQAQTTSSTATDCNCATPIKSTVNWCTGSRGGQYCLNSQGQKRYKPKTSTKTSVVPANKGTKAAPLTGSRGGQYYWKQSKAGSWYKVYIK